MEAVQFVLPTLATAALGAALLVPLRDDRHGKRATLHGSPLRLNFASISQLPPTVANEPVPTFDAFPDAGTPNADSANASPSFTGDQRVEPQAAAAAYRAAFRGEPNAAYPHATSALTRFEPAGTVSGEARTTGRAGDRVAEIGLTSQAQRENGCNDHNGNRPADDPPKDLPQQPTASHSVAAAWRALCMRLKQISVPKDPAVRTEPALSHEPLQRVRSFADELTSLLSSPPADAASDDVPANDGASNVVRMPSELGTRRTPLEAAKSAASGSSTRSTSLTPTTIAVSGTLDPGSIVAVDISPAISSAAYEALDSGVPLAAPSEAADPISRDVERAATTDISSGAPPGTRQTNSIDARFGDSTCDEPDVAMDAVPAISCDVVIGAPSFTVQPNSKDVAPAAMPTISDAVTSAPLVVHAERQIFKRIAPLTRLPLRHQTNTIGWPSLLATHAIDATTSSARHQLLGELAQSPHIARSSERLALCRAYREEDAPGRTLALRALLHQCDGDDVRTVFIDALQAGTDEERSIAIDALAACGARDDIAYALQDRVDALAAKAALAYVDSPLRGDYYEMLAAFLEPARIETLLVLLSGVVE